MSERAFFFVRFLKLNRINIKRILIQQIVYKKIDER